MASEQRGFVFSVTFIIVFATILSTVPAGLQGFDNSPESVIPIDPSILSDFTDSENYTTNSFSPSGGVYIYDYDLGGRSYRVFHDIAETRLALGAKVLIGGWLWLGQLDSSEFISEGGLNRGDTLEFDEIDQDDNEGTTRYTLLSVGTGQSMGTLVSYWNTTEYTTLYDAWDDNALYFLHGVGLASSATADIGSLIIALLFLQLPNVPTLLNLFLAVPIWSCIVYVLWFIIKEMIPFV